MREKPNTSPARGIAYRTPGMADSSAILGSVDATKLPCRLHDCRRHGRRGYRPATRWQVHLATFILDLPGINALVRRLQDAPGPGRLCGFDHLPHRTSLTRSIARLSSHQDLPIEIPATVVNRVRGELPGFEVDRCVGKQRGEHDRTVSVQGDSVLRDTSPRCSPISGHESRNKEEVTTHG